MLTNSHQCALIKKVAIISLGFALTLMLGISDVSAQKRFSKTYPAGKNITLRLINRSGTIEVRGWDRKQVRINASLERPAARIVPRMLSGTIHINVLRDNKGRSGVGSTNFEIYVPYTSSIDIQTIIGNLQVDNIQGGLVSANITSEGDITLTNIGAKNVSAENVRGNIFYDGIISKEGNYRLKSMRGIISMRIPLNSQFKLVATAPSTRFISLGSFSGGNLNYIGNGRRVLGKLGNGSATINITNQFGKIRFLTR
ncbi:MAG: hypothetical protein HKN25_17650 [Pyrinomonadaceae bacterium]|nr:hypothetical protein [Pyrinomonadaceae bacterium]